MKVMQEQGNREQYDLLNPLLDSIYTEFQGFTKKNPDSPLNSYKLTSVNRVLSKIKELLKLEPTIVFLDLLDSDMIPTNSDVLLILTQYRGAMEQYYSKYLAPAPFNF